MTHFMRVILIFLLAMIPTIVIASGFNVGSFIRDVTVREPITCEPTCDGTPVGINLFPGETKTEEVTISNSSDEDLEVMLVVEILTDEIEVTVPNAFLVPGGGSTTQEITYHAPGRARPGMYLVVIGVERGEY